MTDEQVFHQDPASLISSTRIVINGQTFATRNVGSVKITEKSGSLAWPILLLLLAGAAWKNGSPTLAFMLGAAAVFTGLKVRSTYSLIIVAGSGEIVALESRDKAAIQRLCDAVGQAISVR